MNIISNKSNTGQSIVNCEANGISRLLALRRANTKLHATPVDKNHKNYQVNLKQITADQGTKPVQSIII